MVLKEGWSVIRDSIAFCLLLFSLGSSIMTIPPPPFFFVGDGWGGYFYSRTQKSRCTVHSHDIMVLRIWCDCSLLACFWTVLFNTVVKLVRNILYYVWILQKFTAFFLLQFSWVFFVCYIDTYFKQNLTLHTMPWGIFLMKIEGVQKVLKTTNFLSCLSCLFTW